VQDGERRAYSPRPVTGNFEAPVKSQRQVRTFIPPVDVLPTSKAGECIKQLTADAQCKPGQQKAAGPELLVELELEAFPIEPDAVISAFDIRLVEVKAKAYSSIGSSAVGGQTNQEGGGDGAAHLLLPRQGLEERSLDARTGLNPVQETETVIPLCGIAAPHGIPANHFRMDGVDDAGIELLHPGDVVVRVRAPGLGNPYAFPPQSIGVFVDHRRVSAQCVITVDVDGDDDIQIEQSDLEKIVKLRGTARS